MRHVVAVSALSLLFIFAAPPTRTDPYKNFKFRVSLGGVYVAAFSQFTRLESTPPNAAGAASNGNGVPIQVPGSLIGRSGMVTLICSAANRGTSTVTLDCKVPGFSKFEAITLERGVTQDPAFQSWLSSGRSTPPRDLRVDTFNEAGQRTGGFPLKGCTVVMFRGMPALDAGPNTSSVVALELHCNPQ